MMYVYALYKFIHAGIVTYCMYRRHQLYHQDLKFMYVGTYTLHVFIRMYMCMYLDIKVGRYICYSVNTYCV